MPKPFVRQLILSLSLMIGATETTRAESGKFRRHIDPIHGSYIVRLAPTLGEDGLTVAVAQLAQAYRFQLQTGGAMGDGILRHAMKGFTARMSEAAAIALSHDPRVELVEQNARVNLSATRTFTASDPHYNLDRVDQVLSLTAKPELSYSYQSTGSGVDVYVLDSGVWRGHYEFDDDDNSSTAPSNPRVKDGVSFGYDGFPAWNPCGGQYDSYAAGTHGTAVASVVGGKTVGVASDVNIIPVKVVDCNGFSTLEWFCWGMDWIAAHHSTGTPAVANISMFIDSANPWDLTTPISSFEHTVNNVVGDGVTVVVSANNQANGNCTTSPARMGYGNSLAHPSWFRTITVGGVDELDRLWRCANFGDCHPGGSDPGSNTGPCVDVYAMAHDLKVAWSQGYQAYRELDYQRSGTSFSAPLVAGVAARLLQNSPNLTPQQVWDAIRIRAVALSPGFDGDGVAENDRIVYISKNE